MNSIQKLIHTLKNRDIQVIEKYIKNINKSDRKLKLFKLILNDKLIDDNTASIILYNKVTNNIKKLKERLLIDIEDVLILRFNKNNTENIYKRNESHALILLLHAHYYLRHGLLNEAEKKLRKVKKLIDEHNYVFLASFYYQLSCEYLERIKSEYLDKELKDSVNNFSELQFIQTLKIEGERQDSNAINYSFNTPSTDVNYLGFYTKCLDKLTQLKFLINVSETVKADLLYEILYSAVIKNMNQVPLEMYVDILLQKIRINILKKSFVENKTLLAKVKNLSFKSENLLTDFLELGFVNNFNLENYSLCKNMVFCFFSDKNKNSQPSTKTIALWKYFNISIAFIKKEYDFVLELIHQFPGQLSIAPNILINTKMLEFYALILLDDDELVSIKYNSIKRLLMRIDINKKERYEYLLERIMILSEIQGGYISIDKSKNVMNFNNKINIPSQDILGLELIPIEYLEELIICEKKSLQYSE